MPARLVSEKSGYVDFTMSCFSKYQLVTVALLTVSSMAVAEVYRRVDPVTGQVTFTNFPSTPKVSPATDPGEPLPKVRRDVAKAPGATVAPRNFPKVDPVEQKRRDADRLQILKDELVAEQQALTKAERENNADATQRHRTNIASLQREIVAIR
ncbi:hypothetical protein ACHMW6_00270 (plasmid) [Pseudoduganella sp. UC29_106]|uniref:hypothetical protein n=1 Tax=Pseudoduganella sp. UC29_106 TaxID=3374553 RepID=UPI0037567259